VELGEDAAGIEEAVPPRAVVKTPDDLPCVVDAEGQRKECPGHVDLGERQAASLKRRRNERQENNCVHHDVQPLCESHRTSGRNDILSASEAKGACIDTTEVERVEESNRFRRI